MINEILVNVAKILFGIGILFLLLKLFINRKDEGDSEKLKILIYNVHKPCFALSTILGFIHGLTIVPINQTTIITGWLFGTCMILSCIIGIKMGFDNDWKPYNKEERSEHNKVRLLKWLLTILAIVFLGMHYLL